jgi:hypothetical protein
MSVITLLSILAPTKAVADLPETTSGEMVMNKEVISTSAGLILLSPTKLGMDFKAPHFHGSASHIVWDGGRGELILDGTEEDSVTLILSIKDGNQVLTWARMFVWSSKDGSFRKVSKEERDCLRLRAKQLPQ